MSYTITRVDTDTDESEDETSSPSRPPPPNIDGRGLGLGLDPANIKCPYCKFQVKTEVRRVNTSKTHIWAFVLFIFGLWPCCFVPYCCKSSRRAQHSCPICKGEFVFVK